MYKNSKCVKKDVKQAVKWYIKAAEHDHATAKNNLAYNNRDGDGIAKDANKAKELWKKACKNEIKEKNSNLEC